MKFNPEYLLASKSTSPRNKYLYKGNKQISELGTRYYLLHKILEIIHNGRLLLVDKKLHVTCATILRTLALNLAQVSE